MTIEEASRLVLAHAAVLPVERVDLAEAHGRCLATTVRADRDFPPTDRSAMDGFAVRSADTREPGVVLRVAGELPAGRDPAATAVGAGEAVRIMTGAVVPPGADAVVMVELTEPGPGEGGVRILEAVEPGQHVRRRGEDLRAGEEVLGPGKVVGAAEIAALASVGADPVAVVARPSVAIVSTGDEIVGTRTAPAPHQIRDSNARMLAAQVRALGIAEIATASAADEPGRLRAAIETGLASDVVLLTGGVSVGKYDLVGEALAACGVELLFHKVAMKPGKPILAGRRGDRVVFALPGNPVSAFAGFTVFVAPFLRRRMGWSAWDLARARAVLTTPLRPRPDRTVLHLVRLSRDDGRLEASRVRTMGSGDVLSMVRANAFALTPPGRHAVAEGELVDVVPW